MAAKKKTALAPKAGARSARATPEAAPEAAPEPAPMDETKAKFRAALDAKNNRESEGEAHLDGGPSGAQAHGPADTKRTFSRRKTG